MKRAAAVLIACSLLFPAAAGAVQPDEMLKDPAQEQRARNLSAGLRCLVCQNQSIDDSNATVAHDLRVLIRQLIQENKSDAEIEAFLVDRYGEFVLLKPRFNAGTLVLWLAPFAALGAGLAFAWRRRGQRPAAVAPAESLSEAEKAELAALLRK